MRETHDPIEHVRKQLLREGLTDDELKKIDRQMRDVVNAAADFALSDTEPDPTELYTDVVVAD
jgi:pyruvate dehydrogenase E1 component alpha subunit